MLCRYLGTKRFHCSWILCCHFWKYLVDQSGVSAVPAGCYCLVLIVWITDGMGDGGPIPSVILMTLKSTRKHFNRMRTTRLLTVLPHLEGVYQPPWMQTPRCKHPFNAELPWRQSPLPPTPPPPLTLPPRPSPGCRTRPLELFKFKADKILKNLSYPTHRWCSHLNWQPPLGL